MLLKGLKVVEFASYIAAPGAAGLLCDWGAEVIKVERPTGDPMRRVLADTRSEIRENPTFELDNRGKQAIALDITHEAGREALIRLTEQADVFLTNVRLASLKRYGLDDKALRARNPRLVYAVVTGYGLEGPDAAKPGFDMAAFWARGGVAHMTAPRGVDPFMLRSGFGDHICSLATVSAILAALWERERTGEGRLVEASLLSTGIYTMGSDLAVQLRLGRLSRMRTRDDPLDPLNNFFQSAEGRWFVVRRRDGGPDFEALAGAAGRADLLEDPRFSTGRARKELAKELTAELDKGFNALPFETIARRLDDADLVWAPVQTPAEVAADHQAIASGCFVEIEHEGETPYLSPSGPARFPGVPLSPRPPAPALGADTRQLLAGLGYSDAEIEAMLESGAAA
ncbi:MAG: CaiB/BaiF CoA-transferase family protein [Phenylobacterium sp.]|jgi:crotonobetainyl-CoA:carnitine CoA-transferase CaiB-like acyl-CoA transferase|uniref:CaiB/BaiF CoA transferase family protein n=1 Tax=Phenylobacterium sp. TaxID=1871053 RepID=UPI002A363DB6|nr:CaiB/BaiF CoA-transferase family protein [Phenylobacterium sp.]MDX9998824.1 CaiB/BaiF CoA-transferase family protein [Phenylobacterium sp.]